MQLRSYKCKVRNAMRQYKTAQKLLFIALLIAGYGSFYASGFALAQNAQALDQGVMRHAIAISKACPGNWEKQPCLRAMSESNQDMAINYAMKVKEAGHEQELETIKETCAASTAATQGEFPAQAMRSAFTECVNGMYTVSEKTGVTPDQSHYQLIVGAVLCMNNAPQCPQLEEQMRTLVR
ncbi:MAG: hypothetical protein EA357_06260 [Micavibrio sp.]|nr:MAG: hypothetical protein EA357_06260 [Micavibrio sp.]